MKNDKHIKQNTEVGDGVAVAALHTQKKKELHKTHQSFLARSASGLKRSISRPSSPHEEVISVCVCVCVCVCLCCVCVFFINTICASNILHTIPGRVQTHAVRIGDSQYGL